MTGDSSIDVADPALHEEARSMGERWVVLY